MSIYSLTIYIGAQPDAGAIRARRLSYRRTPRANRERLVNLMLKRAEPTAEKSQVFREQVPGLVLESSTLGGPFRGGYSTGARTFVVAGNKLLEVFADMTTTQRGTLDTSTGQVDFAQGVFSMVVVDGPFGYAMRLSDNVFGRITDPDFYGSARVAFLDGRFIFTKPGTQQFYWSEVIDNATSYAALDFASAESAPDDLVAVLVDHREVLLAGERTIEPWYATGDDRVYARNNGTVIEMGVAAAHSIRQIDNSYVWVGRDRNGQGMVWLAGGANGSQPVRISTNEIEEALAQVEDLSEAWAWVYQDGGQTFYVLNCPGLETTWVWDASIRRWHERAELISGEYAPWRASGHVFAFGKHLVGDEDGNLYSLDAYEYTYAGDVIVRDWITPHNASPSRTRVFFDSVRLDATVGETDSGLDPTIRMRASNDGGWTWGDWRARSTGKLGEYGKQIKWDRCGQGRDRVWHFRTTDNAKVSIVGIAVDSREGRT